MSASVDSLSAAVQSLQQVFQAGQPGVAPTAAEIAKQAAAKGFPDADLAVAVWHHLEAQATEITRNVVERRLSEEKISKALFFVLMDPEYAKSVKNKRAKTLASDFRTVLREMAARLGLALADIADIAETTGMGFAPTLTDLADEFAAWLKQAKG